MTFRQRVAAALVVALWCGVAVTALGGATGASLVLSGTMVTAVAAGLVILRRRVMHLEGQAATVVHELRRVSKQLEMQFGSGKPIHERLSELEEQRVGALEGLKFGQRRILASLETERLAAAERHAQVVGQFQAVAPSEIERAVSAAMAKTRQEMGKTRQELRESIRKSGKGILDETRSARSAIITGLRDQTREVEALLQLFAEFRPRAPMPSSGRWALNPTDILGVLYLMRSGTPKRILEIGSGVSTVWMAYEVERSGAQMVSIEHDSSMAARTRSYLREHGLDHVAEVRHAPLTTLTIDGEVFQWYDPSALKDLSALEFVLIDGPPAATCTYARYPALHLIADALADGAVIVLDDADRPDEQQAVERWLLGIDGLRQGQPILGRHAVLRYALGGPTGPDQREDLGTEQRTPAK